MKNKSLSSNYKIGIFSPAASTHNSQRFLRAKQFLLNKGLEIVQGSLTLCKYFYCSGSIKERANELNSLLKSDCDILYATIGGLNSASILPLINYELLQKSPKIFIGNSDISSVLSAVYTKTHQVCYYFMTMLPAFGEIGQFLEENYSYFHDIVLKRVDYYKYIAPKQWTDDWINWEEYEREKKVNSNYWLPLSGGRVEGVLVGGNFSTLVKLCGTEYLFDFSDKILFLEDTLVDASTVESNMATFIQNGIFDKIKGLIICKCEKYDDLGTGKNFSEWIYSFLDKYDFPVLGEFDCGHTHPCLPLLIGGNYIMDVSKTNMEVILNNGK